MRFGHADLKKLCVFVSVLVCKYGSKSGRGAVRLLDKVQ